MHLHAEIQYQKPSGPVHSDLCVEGQWSLIKHDAAHRQLLHDSLNEWLNNSYGTGGFVVGHAELVEDSEPWTTNRARPYQT